MTEGTPKMKRPRMTPEERVERDRKRLEASERKAAEARAKEDRKRGRQWGRRTEAAKDLLAIIQITDRTPDGSDLALDHSFVSTLELMAQGK